MRGITLIGMPGAGKSTIGKAVAEKLGFSFVDLDILIKEKEGRSHAKILEQDGERRLLDLEEKYTLGLDFANTVFSPGGSIIYSKDAMKKLQKETSIVYLAMPLSKIRNRLGSRINLRGIVGLKEKGIRKLFHERELLYASFAHHTIDCAKISDEVIANRIIALV